MPARNRLSCLSRIEVGPRVCIWAKDYRAPLDRTAEAAVSTLARDDFRMTIPA
jgi:hypothetical protein